MQAVREARFAGSWYPGDAEDLTADLDRYFDAVEPFEAPSRVWGLVSPHAGYAYSGPTAAWAYRTLEPGAYGTVVVLAPSHRVPFGGVCPWPAGSYRTPLGSITVDADFVAAALGGWSESQELPVAHAAEHSLEMQLPFLQHRLGSFRLAPVIIGGHSRGLARELAGRLHEASAGRDDVLVVASTDLSHFHPAPAAERLDAVARRCIEAVDPDALWAAVEDGESELCGIMPVMTVLEMARRRSGSHAKVVAYTHSGRVTGDTGSVVGYLAAALW